MPRMTRLFKDFEVSLPPLTEKVIDVGTFLQDYAGVVSLLVTVAVGLTVLPFVSPAARWYVPALGSVYRMTVRSRVLKMLAVLLEAGKTVPEALVVLADSGALPQAVTGRLEAVRSRVEQGEPLADSLCAAGLLTRPMAPLVAAAERARNLPWALTELGNVLAGRALSAHAPAVADGVLGLPGNGRRAGRFHGRGDVPAFGQTHLGGILMLRRPDWRPPGRGWPRGGFTLMEITAALGILGVALVLVTQVVVWVVQERTRLANHQEAQELAVNALEEAHAHPWNDLNPEWAKQQRLPALYVGRGWRIEVRVAPEESQPLVKRVTAVIHWKSMVGPTPPPLELSAVFASRSAGAKGGKS